jgi:ubiquitin thioesterase protein OTUB1
VAAQICAAYLRAHEDDFLPFLFGYEDDVRIMDDAGMPSMARWCNLYVEAVNKDADHLQVRTQTLVLSR